MASYPALDLRHAPGPGSETVEDLLYAELDAFEPLAIHDLETGDGWRVFFRDSRQRDQARAAVALALGHSLLELSPVDVDDGDWARRSQAALTSIRVGHIIVSPPWDVHSTASGVEPGDLQIVIEPSMGFGTGHHATTRLCLELLQALDVAGKRIIDVGTGSGVLALAASLLGAAAVVAMDNDPDALQNARENIARNGAADGIEVIRAELSDAAGREADIVLANLTGAVLQRFAGVLRHLTAAGGLLIVSGFSPDELNEVVDALGMTVAVQRSEGDWAAAALRAPR